MLLTVSPLPDGGRQASMLAEDLPEITYVAKAAQASHLSKRARIANKELLCCSHALAMNGFGERQVKNAAIDPSQVICVAVKLSGEHAGGEGEMKAGTDKLLCFPRESSTAVVALLSDLFAWGHLLQNHQQDKFKRCRSL